MPAYSFHTPALKIDAALGYGPNGRTMSPNSKMERRIANNLIRHLIAAGFQPVSVWDGETDEAAITVNAMLELIFNLDESRVYFKRGTVAAERDVNDDGASEYSVVLYAGNGADFVSDWTFDDSDDGKAFNAALDAFSKVVDDKEGR